MTVLDFTKKTTPVIDKLIKLGFHYESTDKTEAEGIRNPPQLITTWENVMNGVILKIVDTYAVRYDENGVTHQTPTEYITINVCAISNVGSSHSNTKGFTETRECTSKSSSWTPTAKNSSEAIRNEQTGHHQG